MEKLDKSPINVTSGVMYECLHFTSLCEFTVQYRTIVKEYLVNHIRLMHKTDETGMFMCTLGKCATKPKSFPNQERLQKHKTTHVDVSCDECDKRFSAKRNLRRHVKKKHEDDTLSDMVDRAEVVIQN